MFSESKYTRLYYSIVEHAIEFPVEGYVEVHHIIPKSLGGSNDPSNLVSLSPRQHYICHWLLTKMVEGEARTKMSCAFWNMCRASSRHKRKLSSRLYDYARKSYSENHPMKAKSQSEKDEIYSKVSAKTKGVSRPWASDVMKRYHDEVRQGKRRFPSTRTWEVTTPEGETIIVENLSDFCKEHKLSKGNFSTYGKTKGYTAVKLD